jgi:uncharacterized membrane protein YoaK (UPF0700 family)
MPISSIRERRAAHILVATSLATAAGGALDAWVYLAHGHVFANAQSGNVVLMGIALSQGNLDGVVSRLPSLLAFVAGLFLSRLAGEALKRRGYNSRTVRLVAECLFLLALARFADRWADQTISACVGFIAAIQITSLSHVGGWSFNTGMTTGNMRSAATAASRALFGASGEWFRAIFMGCLCAAFAIGAAAGAWLTPRAHAMTLIPIAFVVAAVVILTARDPDPMMDWTGAEAHE